MVIKPTTQKKDVDLDTFQEAELSVQYVALRKQLDISEEVIAKKSDVIQQQKSRIQQLEELLRLRTVEKYASSSESNPLQERMVFNDVEQLADEAEAEAAAESNDEGKGKPAKPRPKRKGLNPEIPRVQQRALLTDEQREGAIDTFFVTVKEELDITPAKVQVIEHLQEKAVYIDDEGNRCMREATRPKHPLGKSVASVALLAYLIIAKYMDGCVPRVRASKGLEIVRNFTIDEGLAPRSRFAGAGFKPLQAAEVKSLGSERCSKRCGYDRIRWDRERRTQVNHHCRVKMYLVDVETELGPLTRDEGRGEPAEHLTGIWHKGGVTLYQALVRNEGTCRSDAKGAAQLDSLRKSLSTDAGHRGGDFRSRVEGSVMGLDQRGIVAQFRNIHNLRGDDVCC